MVETEKVGTREEEAEVAEEEIEGPGIETSGSPRLELPILLDIVF